ncbi:Hypothetical protein CINCED_3A008222 [Cinara cedri]|nr:Hypothetical protein CINCED_3A008222 [Cinara cedri]
MILGIVLGSGSCVYVYIAEICPAEQRPFFSAMVSVFMGFGNIMESSLAVFFHWHTVSIVLAAASSVGCALLFLVPEPPVWLRNRNQIDAAERSERWWFGADSGEKTKVIAFELVNTVVLPAAAAPPEENPGAAAAAGDGQWWSVYARPIVWKPALITLGFFICQQCSGFYVMLFYSVDVLRDFKVPWDGVTVSVYLFGTRVISSVVYACLHRVKRKTLAVASCIGMAASLATIIVYAKSFDGADRPPFGTVLTLAFVVYVFSGQIGMLPMPWILCGEVFPMAVKGTMNGIVQTGGFVLMFSVIKIYPLMVSILGIQNIWTIFTFICILSAVFCLFILPETKGVPLDVILTYFEPHKKAIKINLP